MEYRSASNYDEKINRLINNRNLKDYSCFIGVKTPVRPLACCSLKDNSQALEYPAL